jgi:hypothetical protein
MKTYKFNLTKALLGHKVVLRDGTSVEQLTLFNTPSDYCIAAIVNGVLCLFRRNGKVYSKKSEGDLRMKNKTK